MFTAIFVVGTGRSGTHFTTRVLNGFNNVHDPLGGKEHKSVLNDIAVSAISHAPLTAATLAYYAQIAAHRSKEQIFLDQHHPNLFFIDEILTVFPDAIFLYPRRPVVQIVSSMLDHKGVMSWYKYAWKNKVPFPNKFLGLEHRSDISELKPHLLCAKRVLAHEVALRAAQEKWPDKIRVLDYEALVLSLDAELCRIFNSEERQSMGQFSLLEKPVAASLEKYKSNLSPKEIDELLQLQP